MRAIKRERCGKKELALLKKVLGIEKNGDIEMKLIANKATGNFSQSVVPKVKQFSDLWRFKTLMFLMRLKFQVKQKMSVMSAS
jgi:hypothetical protein